MILRHFKLREHAFGVTPDPRFLYASAAHREALASLLYGIESGLGFVTLTANPGMGKTTLLFTTLQRMQDKVRTVFLFQSITSPLELIKALLIDLGSQEIEGTLVELQTQLNEILLSQCATGKRVVVVIDEAQNLDDSVLEAVRILSNFETASAKLMHIVLAGQLQLSEKLAQPELLQLRQRISIFAQLSPLSEAEVGKYIEHRLHVAGYNSNKPLFTPSAVTLIAQASEGIPRNINNICFNALSLGYALRRDTIDKDTVREVLNDLGCYVRKPDAPAPLIVAKPARKKSRTVLGKMGRASALAACAAVMVFTGIVAVPHEAFHEHGVEEVNASANHSLAVVEVRGGESLSSICAEKFGECGPKLLRSMITVNPGISDPDHIELGQKVFLPTTGNR